MNIIDLINACTGLVNNGENITFDNPDEYAITSFKEMKVFKQNQHVFSILAIDSSFFKLCFNQDVFDKVETYTFWYNQKREKEFKAIHDLYFLCLEKYKLQNKKSIEAKVANATNSAKKLKQQQFNKMVETMKSLCK